MNKIKKNELIFISCGQLTKTEKETGSAINNILKDNYKVQTYWAEERKDFKPLIPEIFRNLKNCTKFIAVLHGRYKIKDKKNQEKLLSSQWVNQEIAVIAYRTYLSKKDNKGCQIILCQDDRLTEGLIKQLGSDIKPFTNTTKAIGHILDWAKNQNFQKKEKKIFDYCIKNHRDSIRDVKWPLFKKVNGEMRPDGKKAKGSTNKRDKKIDVVRENQNGQLGIMFRIETLNKYGCKNLKQEIRIMGRVSSSSGTHEFEIVPKDINSGKYLCDPKDVMKMTVAQDRSYKIDKKYIIPYGKDFDIKMVSTHPTTKESGLEISDVKVTSKLLGR